ncbi:gamma-glutamyl-gamma-aminobutyrate hydrolase family protein [Flavisphingomonas formosensis]|uniref:gamma-glutamyl-gamma-aminobutyrate hydrolase family protein n=1 Tax=Flavisphingomonas formosensis TaxID=861534 RepID=UPI0012FB37AF|nr:gamma-glutamyl-gamma-aminobutyrate hydrolase family protein [Sphingomonas formosensis]
MTARPLIGITASNRPFEGETAQVVIDRYLEAPARHADADALLIPARPDIVDARAIAARLDGLVLTGSVTNVAPEHYGDPGPGVGPFDPGRDAMALAMIDAMIALGKPVFGICRGFQEINVAFGGTLARDLSAPGRLLPHHAPEGASLDAMFAHAHDVTLTPGGMLATGLGRDRLRVNSVHFQGIGALGSGLAVEAEAPDGVIEAVSAQPNGAPVVAVQWHPEWQSDADAQSRQLFRLFGRMLRGERIGTAGRKEASVG